MIGIHHIWAPRPAAPLPARRASGAAVPLPHHAAATCSTARCGTGRAFTRQAPHQRRRHAQLLRPAAAAAPQESDAANGVGSSGRNILVAVDSSEDSHHALEWTVQEIYRPGDVIHVAHCIPYMAVPGGMYSMPDGRLAMVNVDALLASDEQYMMAETQAVQSMCERAFPPEEQVAHVVDVLREEPLGAGDKGRVANALCRKADELQVSVMVIASHAKSGLSEFLLGSVAAHCAAHSTRPVLVLHAPALGGEGGATVGRPGLLGRLASAAASAAASALGGGAQAASQGQQQQGSVGEAAGTSGGGTAAAATAAAAGAGAQQGGSAGGGAGEDEGKRQGGACSVRRSIVLAVDDSEASEKACSWALQHLYRPGDTFHLLRIIPTLPYRASYGGPVLDGMVFYTDPPTEAFTSAAQHYVQHRFEPKLKEAGVRYEVDIVVEAVDESVAGVGQAICQKAEELGAAVVVLGSHISGGLMHFMLGSVATYVAQRCSRPVAVLH